MSEIRVKQKATKMQRMPCIDEGPPMNVRSFTHFAMILFLRATILRQPFFPLPRS